MPDLPFGIFDQVLNRFLEQQLARLDPGKVSGCWLPLPRAEMRPELGRCLLVLFFEQALEKSEGGKQKSEVGNQKSEVRNQKSEGGGRKSEGGQITLTVWATAERTGVDCRVAGLAGATNGEPHGSLTLVKELCASLGGAMTVEAGRGEGLTYRLDFRRKQARATR